MKTKMSCSSPRMGRCSALTVLVLSGLIATVAHCAELARPRIGMLWSEAQGKEDRLTKWARYGALVVGSDSLGLEWRRQSFKDMAEEFDPRSIPQALALLSKLHQCNSNSVVLCEIYFFEADEEAYPPDSPWWFKDRAGKKVTFWKGCYNMAVDNPDYIEHVARRVEAVHNALGTNAGVYLDNLRFDKRAKAGWTALLGKIRERCGAMPIMVNAGWDSDDLEWVAPLVNGIMYEDSVAHTADKDTEKFYSRIQRHWQLLREPRLSLNEKFGKRTEPAAMLRELERTLIYTDMLFLYSDSTDGHNHPWWPQWDAPLGRALEPAAVPQAGKPAHRPFEGGEVLWLPANAERAVTLRLEAPLWRIGGSNAVAEVTLKPGYGEILLRKR
jgi:hypothetical protein